MSYRARSIRTHFPRLLNPSGKLQMTGSELVFLLVLTNALTTSYYCISKSNFVTIAIAIRKDLVLSVIVYVDCIVSSSCRSPRTTIQLLQRVT